MNAKTPDQNRLFVLLEDNWQQAETINDWLERDFPGVRVQVIETVKEFLERLPEWEKNPPQAFILDMMVPYTNAEVADSLPEEELAPYRNNQVDSKLDFFKAGARCYQELQKRNMAQRAIIYSVTDKVDLQQANLGELIEIHLQKGEDKNELSDAIRRRLAARQETRRKR
jgi:hypothetical protein